MTDEPEILPPDRPEKAGKSDKKRKPKPKKDPVTGLPMEFPADNPWYGGTKTKLTEEWASALCHHVSEGMSVRKAIVQMQDEGHPYVNRSQLYAWLNKFEWFRERYTAAVESRVEVMADEMLEIADNTSLDYIIDSEGQQKFNAEAVQRSKLKIETRKWLMGKMNPKKYGDRAYMDMEQLQGGLVISWGGGTQIGEMAHPDADKFGRSAAERRMAERDAQMEEPDGDAADLGAGGPDSHVTGVDVGEGEDEG